MNWLKIRNTGLILLVMSGLVGIYQLFFGSNWLLVCVTLVMFTFSTSFIGLGLLGHHYPGHGIAVIVSEDSVQRKICDLAKNPDVASVDFISAGVSSRKVLFLRFLKEFHKPIRVLVQNPEVAVSSREKVSTIKALYDILADVGDEKWNSSDVKFQFYTDRASLRATIFRDKNKTAICAILGWYTYHDYNTRLSGSRLPSILVDKSSPTLLEFVNEQFERRWNPRESLSDITVAELARWEE